MRQTYYFGLAWAMLAVSVTFLGSTFIRHNWNVLASIFFVKRSALLLYN
jgi:hypothetical protein